LASRKRRTSTPRELRAAWRPLRHSSRPRHETRAPDRR
jgi:hypothetical protein